MRPKFSELLSVCNKDRTAFMGAEIWIQCLFFRAKEDKMFKKIAQFDLGCPGRIGGLLNWY